MIKRRAVLSFLAVASTVLGSGGAIAQMEKKQGKEKKKNHKDGRALLGGKIKEKGQHKIDRAGRIEVTAEINAGKVVGFTATDPGKGKLAIRKVKSKRKFAELIPGLILAKMEIAQYSDYYYGYWFDDGEDDWYYWFTADVVIIDNSWVEYY